MKKYRLLIYSLIRKAKIHDEELVDDLFIQIIMRIQNHDNYNKEKASVQSWITLVSRSVISNYLDKLKRSKDAFNHEKVSLDELKGSPLIQEVPAHIQLKSIINKSKNLSPLWKDILLRRYYHGDSNREVAADLGLSYHNTRKIVNRATTQLRKEHEAEAT